LGVFEGPLISLLAFALAVTIGFVNHQGGTCTVAAVSDLLDRKPGRIIALVEAGLWAFAIGMALKLVGLSLPAILDFPVTHATIAGGVLLGLGAWLNKACLFGTLAQLGRRNSNYLFTLAGLLAGFLIHASFFARTAPVAAPYEPERAVMLLTGALFGLSLLSNLLAAMRTNPLRPWQGLTLGHREAIIIHSIAFTLMASIAGPWTYAEILSRYAHGSELPDWFSLALLLALAFGALVGGWRTQQSEPLMVKKAIFCFAGGALMALGSALVPGGNDLLILYGAPLLQWHAITAIVVMLCTIASCMTLQRLAAKDH
jgi:toxin CptA